MSDYTQYAIALWDEQFKTLKAEHKQFLRTCRKHHVITTPDEKYQVFYWDYLQDGSKEHEAFLCDVEHIRHAIVGIDEDGDTWRDVMSYDDQGCDEEFEEILGLKGEIVLWNEPFDDCELGLIGDDIAKMRRIYILCKSILETKLSDDDPYYDDDWTGIYNILGDLKELLDEYGGFQYDIEGMVLRGEL